MQSSLHYLNSPITSRQNISSRPMGSIHWQSCPAIVNITLEFTEHKNCLWMNPTNAAISVDFFLLVDGNQLNIIIMILLY